MSNQPYEPVKRVPTKIIVGFWNMEDAQQRALLVSLGSLTADSDLPSEKYAREDVYRKALILLVKANREDDLISALMEQETYPKDSQ